MITSDQAYWELVKYHLLVNYPKARENPLTLDGEENKATKGFGLVMNGERTLQELINEDIVFSKNGKFDQKPIHTDSDLARHIQIYALRDWASILSGTNITRGIISNEAIGKMLKRGITYDNIVPEDAIRGDMGTKTLTLLAVPELLPDLKSLFIKNTAQYGTGLGPVIYATSKGVERAAIFRLEPEAPFALDERGTILEDVHYAKEGDRMVPVYRHPIQKDQFYQTRAA